MSKNGAAERVDLDDDEEPPKSSVDLAVEEMMGRLDAVLEDEQKSLDALDRTSLELRRNMKKCRLDSRPKLRAMLASIPPPERLPVEE